MLAVGAIISGAMLMFLAFINNAASDNWVCCPMKSKNICIILYIGMLEEIKKHQLFADFFALSILFFIKLFYLCTDFRDSTIC